MKKILFFIAAIAFSASAIAQKSQKVFIYDLPLGSTVAEFSRAFQQAGLTPKKNTNFFFRKNTNLCFSREFSDYTIDLTIKSPKESNEPVLWIEMWINAKVGLFSSSPSHFIYYETVNHFLQLYGLPSNLLGNTNYKT